MRAYRMKEGLLLESEGTNALAEIVHDLRTPMCCVSGAAQMALQASRQGKDVNEQMQQILLAVDAMDRMLSAACETERGRSDITAEQLERELRAVMAPKAQKKGQSLKIDFSALSGCRFGGDCAALGRVLLNLISNAVKYTHDGGKIEVIGREEKNTAVFCVVDNGMGMKRAFMQKMFVPYERAKESAHLPGRGLGLAIVRSMVQKMGGRLAVYSTWGKGTAFTVRVPLGRKVVQ